MTQTTEIITVSGVTAADLLGSKPSASTEAIAERNRLLAKSRTITTIATESDAQLIAKGLKALKAFTRSVLDFKAEVKAPVLELAGAIEAVSKELTTDLEQEASRLSKLLGAFQTEQARIAEEERQKAWDKEQKLRREAAEAEEAERVRIQNEKDALEAKLAAATTPKQKEKLEAQISKVIATADQEAAARSDTLAQQVVETRSEPLATAAPKKLIGIATRRDLKIEVTDVAALYAAHPHLVKLEPQLALIKSQLKVMIAQNPAYTLPGVSHREESGSIVR